MTEGNWNPWKMTTIGMALVVVTGLVTGLVVANWTGNEPARPPGVVAPGARPVAAPPTPADVDACNQYAKSASGDKTTELVKDAVIGGALGAGVGAAGGAIAGGGKGAGKGAAIGGIVGVAAGTLYGVNENKKNDARYVEAYRTCMRGRGFTG
jgi:hypothetical protein